VSAKGYRLYWNSVFHLQTKVGTLFDLEPVWSSNCFEYPEIAFSQNQSVCVKKDPCLFKVQFEDRSTCVDQRTHLSIDAYDNALFMTALEQLIVMGKGKIDTTHYKNLWADTKNQIRSVLWTGDRFKPHVYINGSCLGSYDESIHYYHGGTTIALLAGVLTDAELMHVYEAMTANVKKMNENGNMTIGMTIYPAYSSAPCMSQKPYTYQNGGDWTWFGARTVQALLQSNHENEALATFSPILSRILEHNGFWEWWDQSGKPSGSQLFRGSAGVVGKAIHMLKGTIKPYPSHNV